MNRIRAEGITKLYPGTCALDNVSIEFGGGEIHAFVGKNGSGKSTLLKIFAGAECPTRGTVYLNNEPVKLSSPKDAFQKGVATVFQELSLVTSCTVAENIFVGRLPLKQSGLVDWRKTEQLTKDLLDDLGIEIRPNALVGDLTVSQMQMVEIAKAMSIEPSVLQLDEPTSSLSQTEATQLFKIMRRLKEKGVVVIFVTHRLQELWDVSDTCTVLRDGHFIGKIALKNASRQDVLKMMFGDIETLKRPAEITGTDETILEVKNLTSAGKFQDISFTLKKSEVLGIAGMLGSGRTELLRAIWGADSFQSGEIIYKGKPVKRHSPQEMKSLGFGMVQEDRKRDGIIASDTILTNATFASIQDIGKGIFYNYAQQRRLCEKQRDALGIKAPSLEAIMAALSGGNQQKVILGRVLNTNPEVLMFDEPSRGIDVAAKQQIFKIIWDLSRQGVTSIVVSSELEELLEVCTRIIVMRNGRFIKELQMDDLTADRLYIECMGA